MYLHSHAQKYIPGVYLHVCKLYMCVNLGHANWTFVYLYNAMVKVLVSRVSRPNVTVWVELPL